MSTQASAFVETVRRTLCDHRMIAPGETVLVAVSGGADSIALLHVLVELQIPLEVAHFDHGTRDGASGEDAEFVASVAERLGLPVHVERRDVLHDAKAAGRTFEEYARDVRYAFLLATAKARRCSAVATAHHADDQAETVLLRMLRGTSPRGLAGIPPVRAEEGIRIVRPLIACSRNDILAWCADRGLAFRHDVSNDDPRHLRNRVRHDLLPYLQSGYNPSIRNALQRLADTHRIEDDLLSDLTRTFWAGCCANGTDIDRTAFAQGHLALQQRAISAMAASRGFECPFERVAAAVTFILSGAVGRSCDLGCGISLRNGHTTTRIDDGVSKVEPLEVALAVPGETPAFGQVFRVSVSDRLPDVPLTEYCGPRRQVFDADCVRLPLSVRRRRPGDRFRPLGMKGSRKLQDYFTDLRISVFERERQLLLIAEGRIVWIVGHAIDAMGAVTANTRRVIKVEVLHEEGRPSYDETGA